MGSSAANPGESVTVNISVDQPITIAAAAFTLTYNTTWFTLTSVESTFFDMIGMQEVIYILQKVSKQR